METARKLESFQPTFYGASGTFTPTRIRQRATYDSSRVDVTSSAGEP